MAGTRDWSETQKQDILAGRTPTHNGEKIEGHHSYNVAKYPHLTDRADIIYPATKDEHQGRWHGGDWGNDTEGQPLDPNFPEEF